MFRYSLVRVYQEWKSMMMGMGHDNSMIYSQDDTIIELTHKLNMTVSILNSAPILVKNNDEDERLVLRQQILNTIPISYPLWLAIGTSCTAPSWIIMLLPRRTYHHSSSRTWSWTLGENQRKKSATSVCSNSSTGLVTGTVTSTWTKANILTTHVPGSALSCLVSRCLNRVS